MSERKESVSIHRILVAVDASPHSQAALEAAVDLAARFNAELEGLFVEDLNVLRAAEMPSAQELGKYSARRRRISVHEIERHFRARSRQMRRVFRALVEREGIRGAFRVARGMVQSEIQLAAERADVLIIGRVGWSGIRPRRLGSTARAACFDEAPRVTVMVQKDARLEPPILVVYDGSSMAGKTLAIGAALVDETSGPLRILLVAEDEEALPSIRAQANACIQGLPIMRQFQGLATGSVTHLAHVIRGTGSGTLVLPAELAPLRDDLVSELVERVEIPVLLVR